MGVLSITALLFGVCIGDPDFWKLPIDPEGPSAQYLRCLAAEAIKHMSFWNQKPQMLGTWPFWMIMTHAEGNNGWR